MWDGTDNNEPYVLEIIFLYTKWGIVTNFRYIASFSIKNVCGSRL